MSDCLKNEFLDVRNRAWTTSCSRYNASRRLKRRSRLSLGVISLLSACGVAIPLISAYPEFAPKAASLGLFSALLSLFVLVVAVLEAAASFDTKAESLYRNAELLNGFRMRVNILIADGGSISTSELRKIVEDYEHIRDACAVNHDFVDYKLQTLQHPRDYGLKPTWLRVRCWEIWHLLHSTWWLFGVLIATAILLKIYLT